MPKQLYKITQFHGGLNNNSDARDIAENELSEATDVMVDELGKIRLMGGIAQHYNYTNTANNPNNAATINPGYGLFQFSHDRLGATTTGSAQAETGDDYLAMVDATNKNVDLYSRVTNTWGTAKITLGTTAGAKAAFYVVDGSLRVSDGNFGANNKTMWYGYIYRYFFGDNASGFDIHMTNGVLVDQWHSDEAAPKALSIKNFCGNYNDPAGSQIGTNNFPTAAYPVTVDLDPQGTAWVDVSSSGDIPSNADSIKTKVTFSTSSDDGIATAVTNTTPGFDNFCSVGDKIQIKQAEDAANNNAIFTVKAIGTSDPNVITFEEALAAETNEFCFMFY